MTTKYRINVRRNSNLSISAGSPIYFTQEQAQAEADKLNIANPDYTHTVERVFVK